MVMKIPGYVSKIMWENGGIVSDGGEKMVVERVLELGDDRQVEWVLGNFRVEEIGDILKKSKKISGKSANYWAKYLKIPAKQVECLKQQWPSRQDRFGTN